MSSDAKTDGGSENSFAPSVLTEEADVAESLRMPWARDAEKVMEILRETDSVALKLQSSWWGNEAFGVWSEWFFVKPDGVSPSGKALFVDEGVAMSDAVRKLRAHESILNDRGGLTASAARKFKRKAFHWQDDSAKPGPGMLSTDERYSFTGGSCPLSVVDRAFRLPEPENDLVFPADGDVQRGKMSEGDVRVTGSTQTKYGLKAVLKGDTYNALSSQGDNISDDVWDEAHPSYNGDVWTCDPEGDSLHTLINALNDGGYSVSVDESFESRLEESKDIGDSFGVDL